MSKRAAKLTLISIGIICVLLLILYLPVLIWSPPWGENGYYLTGNAHLSFIHFHNGNLNTYSHKKHFIHESEAAYQKTSQHTWDGSQTFYHHVYADGNIKHLTYDSQIYIFKSNLSKSHESFFYTGSQLINLKEKFTVQKSMDPFTIWHIKYLEWTQ